VIAVAIQLRKKAYNPDTGAVKKPVRESYPPPMLVLALSYTMVP
jgi:hypothetical protein